MASANYRQLGSNNYIQRRVDMYVLGSCIEVQHCHCPSSPNVPQNRYCMAPGWSVCRRGADRSSQVGCGKRASWGGGATAPPTVREASSLEKSDHYCYAYILAYIHMIALMRGSLSSFPLVVGRKVSRLVAEVQPRQKWLTVHYLIAY